MIACDFEIKYQHVVMSSQICEWLGKHSVSVLIDACFRKSIKKIRTCSSKTPMNIEY